MPMIRTLIGFLIRIVVLVLVILVLGLILISAAYYLIGPSLPITPSMLINPQEALAFTFALMDTDFFRIVVFPGFTFVALYAAIAGLWERKLLAKMQLRVGPLYAGKFEGILQPIADVMKLLSKELVIPKVVDRFFFILAPILTVTIATAAVAVIPVTERWVIARSDVGVLVIFAVLAFFPLTALMAAWSSNSRYPMLGGLRALHQMVAYEIPLILSVLTPVVLTGSLNLLDIVEKQSSLWFILLAPISALTFYICSLAELERIPFDLPEAEPELVSGWLTEYGGMNFGLILGIAVYIKLYVLSALFTLLFLGGWLGPQPLPPDFWFIFKAFIVTTFLLIPRGVFPRLRIDLLLKQSWARYFILALINLVIAAAVVLGGFKP
ncbi:MAG: NADH-quinone oxidoreductase subunit NuoH [Thaumarchaeota archaeon]|nr:NADH-quinone oxidoreductase subunit NuoH [Nitrososphaerota archaeon]